jgi:tetratricopeptide (TPR) repeat protein
MTSLLLAKIDDDIARSPDQVVADCHRARRARYLVRVGRFEEVNPLLAALREAYSRAPVAELTASVNLAEGLASFFLGKSKPALDKLRRAHAIACAANIRSIRAVCAAWLAHLEFGFLQIPSMAAHVREALEYADGSTHEALSRASLVVAVALHSSNRYDLAKVWYSKARVHAAAEGDDATLSALLHNMTSMGVMNLRQSVLTGSEDSSLVLDTLMGAASTSNYDSLKGMSGLTTWVPLLRAYVAALIGDPQQALTLYGQHVEEALEQGQERMLPYIQADMAWCYVQTQERDLARASATAAEQSLALEPQIDDRAASHSRLSSVFSALGAPDLASKHGRLAEECWSEYTELQHRTVGALAFLSAEAPRG